MTLKTASPQPQAMETLASSRALEAAEEFATSADEQKIVIRQRLEELRVPSVFGTRIVLLSVFVLILLVPTVVTLVW
jgi:hypothetical protein